MRKQAVCSSREAAEEGRRVQAVGYRDQEATGRGREKNTKQIRSQDKPCCMQTGREETILAQQNKADRTIDALPADRGNAICT